MFQAQNRETINSTWKAAVSFKIIMTTSVTRPSFTTQHFTCKTKTKTDVFVPDRSCPKTDGLRPHHWSLHPPRRSFLHSCVCVYVSGTNKKLSINFDKISGVMEDVPRNSWLDIGGDARHDTPVGSSKQLFAIAGWGQATIRTLRSTPQMMTTMLIGLWAALTVYLLSQSVTASGC